MFAESTQSLQTLGLRSDSIHYIRNPDWAVIEADLQWLAQPGNQAITLDDSIYPALLLEIPDPPPVLFVRGAVNLLSNPQLAIVGSRNPTRLGKQLAEEFASTLAKYGFAITSGLALGIDVASHIGAIKTQGHTIAVAGTGLDRVYPARHKQLALDIANNGAIVSEFLPGTPAKAANFPRRNRIISGLSVGLLVVEAAKQSGSLITARMALEQGREVFAIPGSINNPQARGCNALIREGAKLVETTQDILEELPQYFQQPEPIQQDLEQTKLDLEQQSLLNSVLYSPTSIDDIVRVSGKSVEVVASQLLLFELQGYIVSVPGGQYMRVK